MHASAYGRVPRICLCQNFARWTCMFVITNTMSQSFEIWKLQNKKCSTFAGLLSTNQHSQHVSSALQRWWSWWQESTFCATAPLWSVGKAQICNIFCAIMVKIRIFCLAVPVWCFRNGGKHQQAYISMAIGQFWVQSLWWPSVSLHHDPLSHSVTTTYQRHLQRESGC